MLPLEVEGSPASAAAATPMASSRGHVATVARSVSLAFTGDPSALGLSDIGWGSTILGGSYSETLTGLRAQPITVKGTFVLYRVTNIPTLTE